ncbi:uncharacterized protein LOC130724112 [Lotus japonicus]|uniref:uncharacterized protein LOC130724112 n=1 Tax=Lotus japonicus TaxID=34305 RepID=UPI00258C54B7|nr:uncharacterized protein LOC130724112 [Lotus japonicus]
MEDNGCRGFGRGRGGGNARGRGGGRIRGRGKGKGMEQPTLPSPSQPPQSITSSPSNHDSTTESLHTPTTLSPLRNSVDSTSTHDSTCVHGPNATVDANGKLLVRLVEGKKFESKISREVTKCIKSKFEGAWIRYGDVKRENKALTDVWFGEFKKRCSWPPEQELAVRKAFDQKASSQLSDALYRVRAGQDQGTWIPSEYHAELEEKWKDKNWKEKAKKNSANRKSSDRPLHTGGSITTSEHLKRMI